MKVFVSSLIHGYEHLRQAAREAITSLGHEPIMAEDFRAQPISPQVACLQGLRSADLVVLILVDRYGSLQPESDMSPTHEEYLDARGTKPILLFVQEGTDPEPRQADLLREAQSWQVGLFREGFREAQQLRQLVTRAIHTYELAHATAPMDVKALLHDAEALLTDRHLDRGQTGPILRFAVVGGPPRQLLRPAELEDEALADAIHQRAMFDSPRLFERGAGVDRRIEDDALILEQDGATRISLDEHGRIELSLPLERRSRQNRGGGFMFAIIQERVVSELANGVAFATWLLDHADPTQRIAHVAIAARIEASDHLGWRTQAEHDASPNSGTIRMKDAPIRAAMLDRSRAALKFDATRLAEDLMVPLRRQWKS